MKIKDELLKITHCFETNGIDYALCGGLAVAVHGYPRFTRDIDLLILAEDLDRAKAVLMPLEYDLEGGLFRFNLGTDRESRMYRVSRAEEGQLLTLDLLLVDTIYQTVWLTREQIQLEHQTLKVVSKLGLIAMKQLSGRPQDLGDIDSLLRLEDP
jgi:hypothetical protein